MKNSKRYMDGLKALVQRQIAVQRQFSEKIITKDMAEYGLKAGFIRYGEVPSEMNGLTGEFCIECPDRQGGKTVSAVLSKDLLVDNTLTEAAVMVMNTVSPVGTPDEWFSRIAGHVEMTE